MNIKEAKEQIKNAMTAYFAKDAFGNYCIPIQKQRPIFLMGAPGIGKTSIMEQVAGELGVGLVSYSMTHHTRQSALGLPFIMRKTYGGQEYDVSEYTMSEIIASVYDMIEETGVREGILFLDEINCVSETLAPSMLQFLQFKIFGCHQVPEGWIVVTAGNPPEYNKSVREFDIVTWDRLKRINVEPDFDIWKEYAYQKGVHASVLTYLAAKRDDFYIVETAAGGKTFVTARGWDDLSEMIKLYERNGLPVDERLITQYLQHPRVSKDFAIYYDLYKKYRSDYRIEEILGGNIEDAIVNRARAAKFDERLALLGLLLDGTFSRLREVMAEEDLLRGLQTCLSAVKTELQNAESDPVSVLQAQIDAQQARLTRGAKASALSKDAQDGIRRLMADLTELCASLQLAKPADHAAAFALLKAAFTSKVALLQSHAEIAGVQLSNLFKFAEAAFGESQEMLILVTELTISPVSARFIGRYGCKEYFRHNKELLFYERQKELAAEIKELHLEDWTDGNDDPGCGGCGCG